MTKKKINTIIHKTEVFFAILTLVAVIVFTFNSIVPIVNSDWSDIQTLYTFINTILTIIVGVELAKLLITHDLVAIKDVLIFVIARKLLEPNQTSMGMLIAIIAFAILFSLSMLNRKTQAIETD